MSSASTSDVRLLIINPNSSQSVTDGLASILNGPPGVHLSFYTPPGGENGAPPSINDITTGVASAQACIVDLEKKGLIDEFDGFLVCCFSDHPLTHILREKYPQKPSIGILESSITHALLIGSRFGIITTGTGYKYIYHTDVRNVLGGKSEKFAGLITTGLGVLELREGDDEKIKRNVKDASRKIAEMGADVIILGCAGMAGMEGLVREGVREAGLGGVKVVDGAKAGVEFLAGLARLARG